MIESNIWFTRIKILKEEHNYTMRELVVGIGVSKTAINNWKFKDIKAKHLTSVSKFFNVSSDYILGLTDDREIYNPYPNLTCNQLKLLSYLNSLNLSEKQYNMISDVVEGILQFKSNITD